MKLPTIYSAEDIANLVNELGFLPFFRNGVPGFSLAECTPPELWFSNEVDGPWEWKGPVIRLTGGVYGKFFQNKAGFVSREWFGDFANYRRDGYDFEGCFEDGKASYMDKAVYDVLERHGNMISKALKRACGKPKGYDGSLTRLQMRTFIITSNFEYEVDRYGKAYGWGVARYATPEDYFGIDYMETIYTRTPEESFSRIYEHLRGLFPEAGEKEIRKLIG